MQGSSQGSGPAPEAAQARVRAEMEAAKNAGFVAKDTPVFKTLAENPTVEWYYLVDNKPVGPVSTSDLQTHISASGNCKVCPKGESIWTDASEKGFRLPEVKEDFGVPVVEPVVALGDTTNPKEEELETLPDSELLVLAMQNNLIGKPEEFNRSAAVKNLAALGVTP